MEFHSQWYGLTPYKKGLSLQEQSFKKTKESAAHAFLLGMEHPQVLTLGLRSHKDPLIEVYKESFQEIVSVRRGGHLVIHNPGQLVIYPVLPLKELNLGVRDYVCLLTKVTKELLSQYGIHSLEKDEPGLFVESGKIAMFGVGVRNGITQHGLCLNVRNDLSDFSKIALCNNQNEAVSSLQKEGVEISLQEAFSSWVSCFHSYEMGSCESVLK